MPGPVTSEVEEQLMAVVTQAVEIIKGQDAYFAEASAKYLVRELSWALVDPQRADVSPYDLADHLEGMAETIRQEANDKAVAESAAE